MRASTTLIAATALSAAIAGMMPAVAAEPDWNQVGQALGKSGAVQAGGV